MVGLVIDERRFSGATFRHSIGHAVRRSPTHFSPGTEVAQ
jgi:hypothetical protein